MVTKKHIVPLYLIEMEGKLVRRVELLDNYRQLISKELFRLKDTKRGGLADLARLTQIDKSRLSDLMHGKRSLSTDVLTRLIAAGFVSTKQLLGDRDLSHLGGDESALIEYLQIVEDQEWISLIVRLKKQGKDKEQTAKKLMKALVEEK